MLVTVTSGLTTVINGSPEAIAVSSVDRYGNTSVPRLIGE